MANKMIARRSLLGGFSLDDFLEQEAETSFDTGNLSGEHTGNLSAQDTGNLSILVPRYGDTDTLPSLSIDQIREWLQHSAHRITASKKLYLSNTFKRGRNANGLSFEELLEKINGDRQRIYLYARTRIRHALIEADHAGALPDVLPEPEDCYRALKPELEEVLGNLGVRLLYGEDYKSDRLTDYTYTKLYEDSVAGIECALNTFERGYLARASNGGQKAQQAVRDGRRNAPALKFTTADVRRATGRTVAEKMASVGIKSDKTWRVLVKKAKEEDAATAALLEDLTVNPITGEVDDDDWDELEYAIERGQGQGLRAPNLQTFPSP